MVQANGTLRIYANQTIQFTSQDGKVTLVGVYAQSIQEDVVSPAYINFNGRSGAVRLSGIVGDRGIRLSLSGDTGNGTLQGASVPIPPTPIQGSANIDINE